MYGQCTLFIRAILVAFVDNRAILVAFVDNRAILVAFVDNRAILVAFVDKTSLFEWILILFSGRPRWNIF